MSQIVFAFCSSTSNSGEARIFELIEKSASMSPQVMLASELTVVFGGDTSLGDAYLSKLKYSKYLQRLKQHPLSFFDALEPLISDKYLFIINLETVLSDGPKVPISERKRYCGWDTPERTINAIKAIGVDAVSLANNHTMDFGSDNLIAMLSLLKRANVHVLGAGENISEASKPWKIGTPLGNIYIIAAFELRKEYKDLYCFYAASKKPGVSYFKLRRHNRLSVAISSIRRTDPDGLIIAFPHWGGATNYGPPTERMLEANEGFLEAGADLVLGHGAHNLQTCCAFPVGTTVFSIGNFVFNSPGGYKFYNALPYSLIGRLRLGRSYSGWTGTLKLYPIVSDNRQTGYQPRPVKETEALEVFRFLSIGGKHCFDREFELQRDERGWYIARTTPLSRMFAHHSETANCSLRPVP
jgi:hypothetical protein